MAISKDVINKRFGTTVSGAYIKFCYLGWASVTNTAVAHFSVWATPTSEAEGKESIELIEVDVTHLFSKIQTDMYAEIKKLPEYKNALNV